MRNKFFIFLLLSVFALATFSVSAQNRSTNEQYDKVLGATKSVDEQKIVLQTAKGAVDVLLPSTTTYFRLSPDNLKLSAATDAKLSDISINDRVLVVGTFKNENTQMIAAKIYVVKGSDIAEQQDKQRQEWRRRGISGRVKEVDVTAKTITVEMRSLTGGESTLKITPKDGVKYLRYSANSIKYSDAKESDFSTIQKDDTIQALGDKSEDGNTFTAEEILSGAFVTVAGPVKSIDAEKNEVTILDLKTKKDVTINVKASSLLKRFPADVAQRLARFQAMAKAGGGIQPPRRGNGNRARGGGQGRRGEGGGRGAGRGRMDINQILNRFPTISVSELKVGEMIAVSSAKGADLSRLSAIKLLAGIEPFVTAAASSSRGRRGRGGVSGSLTIPGLQGTDF